MLTLSIPPHRDPIARLTLLASIAMVAWLFVYDQPQQPNWPDPLSAIGQLQYAVVGLAFVIVSMAGTLRRLPRYVPPPAAPAVRVPLKNAARFAILKRDGYRCQICGTTAASGAALEVDHKLAVANGGTNDPHNLWTLCARCNNGKSDLYL